MAGGSPQIAERRGRPPPSAAWSRPGGGAEAVRRPSSVSGPWFRYPANRGRRNWTAPRVLVVVEACNRRHPAPRGCEPGDRRTDRCGGDRAPAAWRACRRDCRL